MVWYEMVFRAVIAFLGLLIWARILGKKLMSQMTFFDFVAGVTLGSIGGSIMFSANINLAVGLLGLSVFAAMALLTDIAALKSFFMRKKIDSEPTLVIKNGKILEQGMSKVRLPMDNLLMILRKKDVFYIDEVEFAFFETDGTLTVRKKTDLLPLTQKDLNVVSMARGLPQTIMIDGQILQDSLASVGKDEDWLRSILQQRNIPDMKQVVIAQIDQLGNVHIDERNDQIH